MTPRALTAVVTGAVAVAAAGTIAVVATGALTPGTRGDDAPASSGAPGEGASPDVGAATGDAAELAAAFLDQWVDDGRVVRRDEGGDTVSEGQAYGMLAAVVADDEDAFDRVWDWTTENLQRDDDLLAWRWQDGSVVDDQPASDADLDAARALVLAADAFDRPDLRSDGVEVGDAVLDHLTATVAGGRILLPGLWAAGSGPYSYNPSYASPAAFEQLQAADDDPRWGELLAGTTAVTTTMLDGAALPPDWAQVTVDGAVNPLPGPTGNGSGVQFGYDAARMPLRFAESCRADDRALAARTLAPRLHDDSPGAVLDLGGGTLEETPSALSWASRAAAATAAGERSDARSDLSEARDLADQQPTYYGRAWAALAQAMLTTDALGGCAADGARS